MDTRLLLTFTTLARTGGFTATAAELHLAQSTVTVHIRTLERELGTRLFDRLPTGTVLTDAGRRLLEGAEGILDAVARLRAAGREGDGVVRGRVRVGTPESLCATRLPGVIAALRARHPEVDVDLHAAGTAECVEGLRAGRLDLALLLASEADFPEVTAEPVAHEPLALVCAPHHPLAARTRPATWARLAKESFFLLEQGCSYSDALERRLLAVPGSGAGSGPRLTRFGSADAARSCAAAGLGLTLLPLTTVEDYLGQGRLTRVRGPVFADVPVRLARHRRRWTAPATEAFARELVRQLGA
ncbi:MULTISPECIES: LysR family transcriptional regulator [Streptomyces]|uniref:DNA-binding transcriptional LysR family regulator n=1 Tax=Streptomyces stelliscabiei TaxID=146820 RepID=A0A8I0P7T4_9ACTN|nr:MULTISPECIES: LysR family transcriptional regulator [Streptomyces]KND43954.1 LysR family transcriptional regulator [Streptomyces stelliscabiei]MBE1598719.1 DNA-binding transcriptional LysR family regulator [Streptomyces stelliscabiei]MDX2516491.1 LysR family transcriptional regulator [Streptomyces stelliscabiei]MDX2553627.1 LysR family transcriptional regulator [Streptomyces stelliscabiei]MDX2613397.1 LysR family transcriptional regulator [Streptomyces stelliscabiei]